MSGVSGADGQTRSNGIDHSAHIDSPKGAFKHEAPDENQVTSSNESGSQSTGTPTTGGRQEVVARHKELEEMVEERCAENPDYVALKDKLASCDGLEDMFLLIDKNVGWRDDQTVLMSDILALVNDTNQPNKELRAAGKWLNDHRDILFALKKDDDRIGLHDVKDFIDGMKAELKGIKDAARAEIKAERGDAPSGSGQTGTSQNAATSGTDGSPESSVPRPPPSTATGMDGATENLAITGNYLQDQMMALAKDSAAHPENATLNGQKIALLQTQFQAITTMMNQLTQMISNMSKMWSDVAMNSIRNLR